MLEQDLSTTCHAMAESCVSGFAGPVLGTDRLDSIADAHSSARIEVNFTEIESVSQSIVPVRIEAVQCLSLRERHRSVTISFKIKHLASSIVRLSLDVLPLPDWNRMDLINLRSAFRCLHSLQFLMLCFDEADMRSPLAMALLPASLRCLVLEGIRWDAEVCLLFPCRTQADLP